MTAVRGRLLNVLKVLSALACAASVLLWMRSYRVSELVRTERNYYDRRLWRCVGYGAVSSGGGIGLSTNDSTIYLAPGEIDELMTLERDGRLGRWTCRPLSRKPLPPELPRRYAQDAVTPDRRWLGFGFRS